MGKKQGKMFDCGLGWFGVVMGILVVNQMVASAGLSGVITIDTRETRGRELRVGYGAQTTAGGS